jgi:acyl carrier protein phosphodiesterase
VNFLAHSLFAQGDSERTAGQFCGDFVRGSDLSAFPVGIQEGIRRHRRIDAYTDSHPVVKASQRLFEPPLRRFAGIICDVVYDFYLARDWEMYSDIALPEHIEQVHAALNEHRADLPTGLQRLSDFLQKDGTLLGNLNFEGIEITLNRLARRSSRFAPLADGASVARAHETELSAGFHEFFPELLEIERKIG